MRYLFYTQKGNTQKDIHKRHIHGANVTYIYGTGNNYGATYVHTWAFHSYMGHTHKGHIQRTYRHGGTYVLYIRRDVHIGRERERESYILTPDQLDCGHN